jgi:hypothetical protein
VQEQIKAKIPMGRFGLPEEIAKAVAFLAAEGAYITEQRRLHVTPEARWPITRKDLLDELSRGTLPTRVLCPAQAACNS